MRITSERKVNLETTGSLRAPFLASGGQWVERLGFAAEDEFDEAVEDEADPGVDQKAPVETVGLVLCGRGQVRHEGEEVEQAAEDDGDELFQKAGHRSVASCQLAFVSFQFPTLSQKTGRMGHPDLRDINEMQVPRLRSALGMKNFERSLTTGY
jgi:hypothetical protein